MLRRRENLTLAGLRLLDGPQTGDRATRTNVCGAKTRSACTSDVSGAQAEVLVPHPRRSPNRLCNRRLQIRKDPGASAAPRRWAPEVTPAGGATIQSSTRTGFAGGTEFWNPTRCRTCFQPVDLDQLTLFDRRE